MSGSLKRTGCRITNTGSIAAHLAALLVFSGPATAIDIDNDLPITEVGHFLVGVENGGSASSVVITAQPAGGGPIVQQTDVLYDYQTYIDLGEAGAGFNLATSTVNDAVLNGDDTVVSTGSFLGEFGNVIFWTAESTIPTGTPGEASSMVTTYTFAASMGLLGPIRLLQYLDEDVQGSGNDVFFTRGDAASTSLELFTVDNTSAIGVSHGGGFSAAQGLSNSFFAGFAADTYPAIEPRIVGAGQTVSVTGVISIPPLVHPIVGPAFGPTDVVSVLAWDVNPEASVAVITTSIGGVPTSEEDLEPPICDSLERDGNTFFGHATDDTELDTGIATIEILDALNLLLFVDGLPNPENPLELDEPQPSVDFGVVIENTISMASGTVRVTDGNGNTCSFPAIEVFGDPIVNGPFDTDGWPEAIQIGTTIVGEGSVRPDLAHIAMREAGVDIDDISDPTAPLTLSNFTPNGNCAGANFFADEVEVVSLEGVIGFVSGGECGVIGVDFSDPENPEFVDNIEIPNGEVEEVAVAGFFEGEEGLEAIGAAAAFWAGLVTIGADCSGEVCVPTILDSIGGGDPSWGKALAVWVEQNEVGATAFVATTEGLQIVDISDPSNLMQLGFFDTNPDDLELSENDIVPQDVVVSGDHAYLPVWLGGLMIIDVSDPALPTQLGTTIQTDSAFFKIEISTVDDRIYATEGLEGLAVFRRLENGFLLRDRQIPIGVGDERCTFTDGVADVCWTWAVDEVDQTVAVTFGIWPSASDEGGYVLINQDNTVACGLIGIEPFIALAPWLLRRARRNRKRD